MYAEDSFFTLTPAGQVGLACLSLGLTSITLIVAWLAMGGRGIGWRMAISMGLFFLFAWLSPQAYYTYYLTLFDGLPWQNVIRAPPGPLPLAELLTFRARPTLSAHSLGVLGWMLIIAALVRPRFGRRGARK